MRPPVFGNCGRHDDADGQRAIGAPALLGVCGVCLVGVVASVADVVCLEGASGVFPQRSWVRSRKEDRYFPNSDSHCC